MSPLARSIARCAVTFAAFAMVLLFALSAHAHKPSDSYVSLELKEDAIVGRWDIAVRDLDHAIGLDADGSGTVTWGELRARQGDIATFALKSLELRERGPSEPTACASVAGTQEVVNHSDGAYVVLRFSARCTRTIATLDVGYTLFFDLDPQHRGLLRVDAKGVTRAAALSTDHRHETFELTEMSRWRPFVSMVKQGMTHIAEGIDHLLFLLALLLPSVLRRDANGWQPVMGFRAALVDVAKIVTAFTLAHSITLSLAALQFVSLPSRFVESAIAASVVVAALNNVRPMMGQDRWMAAFALGLLHGFGFSSALVDLGLPREGLVLSLFGFNLGVEIGQFAVVAAFLPLAYLARNARAYRRIALVGGSLAIGAIASVWLVERAFEVKIF